MSECRRPRDEEMGSQKLVSLIYASRYLYPPLDISFVYKPCIDTLARNEVCMPHSLRPSLQRKHYLTFPDSTLGTK